MTWPRHAQDVLDVGGGPGGYARWLMQQGHSVRLIDPVPRHVEHARALGSGWSDDVRRAALLGAARLVEDDPEIIGLGGHLMAVGRRA